LHRFCDIARYWLIFANFNTDSVYLAPPLMGVTTFDFQQDLWQWKTAVPWLSYTLLPWTQFSRFGRRRPTCNGQTDGHTGPQHIPC